MEFNQLSNAKANNDAGIPSSTAGHHKHTDMLVFGLVVALLGDSSVPIMVFQNL
jgi:hypothetical protein